MSKDLEKEEHKNWNKINNFKRNDERIMKNQPCDTN